jgi:hypothetical protein
MTKTTASAEPTQQPSTADPADTVQRLQSSLEAAEREAAARQSEVVRTTASTGEVDPTALAAADEARRKASTLKEALVIANKALADAQVAEREDSGRQVADAFGPAQAALLDGVHAALRDVVDSFDTAASEFDRYTSGNHGLVARAEAVAGTSRVQASHVGVLIDGKRVHQPIAKAVAGVLSGLIAPWLRKADLGQLADSMTQVARNAPAMPSAEAVAA